MQWVGTIQQLTSTGPVAAWPEGNDGPDDGFTAWDQQYEQAQVRQVLLVHSEQRCQQQTVLIW